MAEKSKEFGVRLKAQMESCGYKARQLAIDLGLNPGSVWPYVRDGRIPEAPILYAISKKLNTTMEYLLTGKHAEGASPHILQFGHEDPEIISEAAAEERLDSFIPVRILADAISMGPGMRVSDGSTGGYAVIYEDALPKIARHQRRQDEKIICLWARGDSMNPTIQPGALVAVDLRVTDPTEVENRKIYAVWLPDGGVTLKRVVKHDGHLILIADNQEAEGFPMVLAGRDAEQAIRGKVVWWWSKQD